MSVMVLEGFIFQIIVIISVHCFTPVQIYVKTIFNIFLINSYEKSHTMDALDGEECIGRWVLTTALQIPVQGTSYRQISDKSWTNEEGLQILSLHEHKMLAISK